MEDNEIYTKDGKLTFETAGKLYPATATKHWNMAYRFFAHMKENVSIDVLQQAVNATIKRFPAFRCGIEKGFLWHYLVQIEGTPTVVNKITESINPVEIAPNKHPYRILCENKDIVLEGFHGIADGSGAIVFFNTLLKTYLELKHGIHIEDKNSLNINLPFLDEEIEDAYVKHADLKYRISRIEKISFRFKYPKILDYKNKKVQFIFDDASLKTEAKKYSASPTQFLIALLMISANRMQGNNIIKKPIAASIPIDLRNIFPSKTLRNFSYFTRIRLLKELKNPDLNVIIQNVQSQLKLGLDKDLLLRNINVNVKDAKNKFLGIIPRFIKDFGINIAAYFSSERADTFIYSSLGKYVCPEEFKNYMDGVEVSIIPGKHSSYVISSLSYNGKMVMNFSRNILEPEFEKSFSFTLKKFGIDFEIVE